MLEGSRGEMVEKLLYLVLSSPNERPRGRQFMGFAGIHPGRDHEAQTQQTGPYVLPGRGIGDRVVEGRRCASEERLATWNGGAPAVDLAYREA